MRPNFSQIEDVVAEALGLSGSHRLLQMTLGSETRSVSTLITGDSYDVHGPRGKLSSLDRLEKCLGAIIRVLTSQPCGRRIIESLYRVVKRLID
jgi:hypothetical protein